MSISTQDPRCRSPLSVLCGASAATWAVRDRAHGNIDSRLKVAQPFLIQDIHFCFFAEQEQKTLQIVDIFTLPSWYVSRFRAVFGPKQCKQHRPECKWHDRSLRSWSSFVSAWNSVFSYCEPRVVWSLEGRRKEACVVGWLRLFVHHEQNLHLFVWILEIWRKKAYGGVLAHVEGERTLYFHEQNTQGWGKLCRFLYCEQSSHLLVWFLSATSTKRSW